MKRRGCTVADAIGSWNEVLKQRLPFVKNEGVFNDTQTAKGIHAGLHAMDLAEVCERCASDVSTNMMLSVRLRGAAHFDQW
jgi:hypothetical protein